MKKKIEKIALDSQRSVDASGHLRVARTILSKAAVNPYFGKEIPDYEELGLEPEKVYYLYRDSKSLEEGADTFKGKPLLMKHEYIDSEKMEKDLIIGTVGSNITYENDTMYGDITVWDAEAIELIEAAKMEELSASYWYRAEMTAGEFEGQPYDGVMLDIQANHIALVRRGRIGRDAVISDNLPLELEFNMLKKGVKQRMAAKLNAIVKGGIAKDSDVEDVIREVVENIEHKPAFDLDKIKEIVGDDDKFAKIADLLGERAAKDGDVPKAPEGGAPKPAQDTNSGEEPTAKDTDDESKPAQDTDGESKPTPAMDEDAVAARVQAIIDAKYQARDKVEPLVGRIALDGFKDASSIYAFALKEKGIACDGVNEAGLAQLVAMASSRVEPTRKVAQDSDYEPCALTSRFNKAI